MFSTSIKEFLKKVSIHLLVVFTVASSFAFSAPVSAALAPVVSIDASAAPTYNPNGFTTLCASEGQPCTFTGTKVVRYGANGSYLYKMLTNSATCNTTTFGGDPAYMVAKSCYYRDVQFDDGIITDVSGRNKTVTVSFNVYSTQVGTLTDLKNNITVEKTGDTAFSALGANDTITLSNTGTSSTLVFNFDTALVGSTNAINIASGALMDQNGNPYNMGIRIDNIAASGAYTGSSSSDGNNVYLNFSKSITTNNDATVTADTYLRSHMSIATDGVNFVPLTNQITVYSPGENGIGSNQIYLSAQNGMKVILGTNTLIKITSGTLKDAAGDLNDEMILHVTPPVVQSATISSDYHDVTISFQEDVVDNGVSNLSSSIYLLPNGANNSNRIALTSGDTASIVSGKLVIHFATALSGANNQIIINAGALKDSYGNVLGNQTLTPLIQGGAVTGDTTALQYVNGYLSNGYQDLTLVFSKDVLNAKSDPASFISGVQYYSNATSWQWRSIPSTATVTFSGKTAIIHFAAPLTTGYQYYFQFNPGSFKDTSGNIYNQNFNAGWFYPGQPLALQGGGISHNGRWLSLNFNTNIADLTIVNGISQLKDQITISTDNGSTFKPLDTQDVVVIQGSSLVVFFHNAIQSGSVEVKTAANAISDLGNNVQYQAIDQVIAYNYPDITGFFLSDTASGFVFADNAEWRSKVRDITISDANNGVVRQLNSSEYTLSAGMLTINKGVFQEGDYYYISVNADGYSSQEFEGHTYVSTELFYMTTPVVTTDNGISATVNIFKNNNSSGTQAVVFELMNGTTPVSIVASNLSISTGSYSANFNVADAATNPNYTVKVFVVNQYNNDPTNVGLNLASIKTQSELDQLEYSNNND
ncbi:Ig-like domain-containing protein [Paenibacillus rigui]|uniref:Heme-binding protein Shr-like Hb-interacting domain-containing protein n=1 Tax=Paenibacillus rigui TaxID=554312 RepID=A0A229UGU9_9BACL|nr:Ig-like domain-containing protein [Paenibacillus rigui]OXM82575.1 hypothetical protein CF651_30300 [Paenibacillus rigui]